MHLGFVWASALLAGAAFGSGLAAQRPVDGSAERAVRVESDEAQFAAGDVAVDGETYRYRLLRPAARFRWAPQPLVVYLHGAGERGDENRRQLTWLPAVLAAPAQRERFPCYVLAVQCPAGERWVDADWGDAVGAPMAQQPTRALAAVQRAMAVVLADPGVDRGRVYATGLSMGGYGAWELAARDPDRFAALLAVCGGGDVATVPQLLALPTQVWHGERDTVVPVERSRAMVARFAELGARADYHEVAGAGHDVWKQAYGDAGGLAWLFAQDQRQQRRGAFAQPALVPRPANLVVDRGVFRLANDARCHVDEATRSAAAYFTAALAAHGHAAPGLVRDEVPRPGDLVLRIDPDLAARFTLEIGEQITLRARHRAALLQGLAATYQVLHTWPGLVAPTGSVVSREPPAPGRIAIGPGPAAWSHLALQALLRECWLYGVGEVAFDVSARAAVDRRDWRAFEAAASELGVAIVAGDRPAPEGRLVADDGDEVDDVLRRTVDGAVRAPYELRVTRGGPDGMLGQIRRLLPAVVERAHRLDGPVHVAAFRARAAARWREPR